jgi:mRNA interferase RelE/StbE
LGRRQVAKTTAPPRTALAAPRFIKAKKKLPEVVQLETDKQVHNILEDPMIGEKKSGVLKDVRVEKFKANDRQYLLAYIFDEKTNAVEFLDIGVHENYYKDLSGYLGSRPKRK